MLGLEFEVRVWVKVKFGDRVRVRIRGCFNGRFKLGFELGLTVGSELELGGEITVRVKLLL